MEMFNNVLLMGFMVLAVFMSVQFLRVNKKIVIKSRRSSTLKLVLFGGLLFLNFITIFMYQSFMDIVRIVVISVVIIIFMVLKDGVGEEGVVVSTSLIPYSDISAYDYAMDKKAFKVYVEYRDENDRKKNRGPYVATVSFDKEKDKEVIELLQNKLPKKYKRMKKS